MKFFQIILAMVSLIGLMLLLSGLQGFFQSMKDLREYREAIFTFTSIALAFAGLTFLMEYLESKPRNDQKIKKEIKANLFRSSIGFVCTAILLVYCFFLSFARKPTPPSFLENIIFSYTQPLLAILFVLGFLCFCYSMFVLITAISLISKQVD